MSNLRFPIPTFVAHDQTIDTTIKPAYVVQRGGSCVTYQQWPVSTTNQNTLDITMPPPDIRTWTSRSIFLQQTVTVTLNNPDGVGPALFESGYDGFSFMPLHQAMASLNITMNGNTISTQPQQWIGAYQYMNKTPEMLNDYLSGTTSHPDASMYYGDLIGSTINPLAPYINSNYANVSPRGAFPMEIDTNNDTSAVIIATLQEPLLISPCLLKNDGTGFNHVNSMTINIVWSGQNARTWKHIQTADGGKTDIATVNVVYSNSIILVRYVSNSEIEPIPRELNYDYKEWVVYPFDIQTPVPFGATTSVTTQNLQLSSVPEAILIFVRRQQNNISFETTDTFATINNISVSFDNQQGLLSNCSQFQLWNLSVQNGVDLTWPQFQGSATNNVDGNANSSVPMIGSLICLRPGISFALRPSKAPGCDQQINFYVQIEFTNQSTDESIPFSAVVVIVNNGVMTLIPGASFTNTMPLTAHDVLDSPNLPHQYLQPLNATIGQGLFSDIGSFFGKAITAVLGSPVGRFATKLIPAGRAISTAVDAGKAIYDVVRSARGSAMPMHMRGHHKHHRRHHRSSSKGRKHRRGHKKRGGELIGAGYDEEHSDECSCSECVTDSQSGSGSDSQSYSDDDNEGGNLIGGKLITREQLKAGSY